jgi:hypothetical protein
MRWTYWVLALLTVPGLLELAAGAEVSYGSAGLYNNDGSSQAWSRPACAGEGFGCAPGCCRCQGSCSENAWANYCRHKACWQTFWTWVGAPRRGCRDCRVGCGGPIPSMLDDPPAMAPMQPSLPAAPAEPANKTLEPTPAAPQGKSARPPDPPLAMARDPTKAEQIYTRPPVGFR